MLMLKIAICEDDKKTGSDLLAMIDDYTRCHNLAATILFYHSAEALEEDWSEHGSEFDLIFFDIMMPELDGFTCARHLRQHSQLTRFVFVTSSREYVFAGYEVNASGYLLKPFTCEQINATLERVLQEISDIRSRTVDVKSHGKVHRLALEDIMQVEIDTNAITLLLSNNARPLTLYEKLDDFLVRAHYDFFIRVHKSYAVNFLYVDTFKTDKVLLKNGVLLPISRTYKNSAREHFFSLLHRID
ncbi:MAG: LytTR family DNA-binding domain-containing protein [Acidaminococcaceae bacterium]